MDNLHIVILAAGKGTRMKSERPKILHELAGRPLIEHVLRTIRPLEAATPSSSSAMAPTMSAPRSRGTPICSTWCSRRSSALATRCCRHSRCSTVLSGTVLLLYADVPLLQTSTLSRLAEHHQASLAAATVLTAELTDPYGYGRIVRDEEGKVARIVEERDASADERTIREINSGIYAFALGPLFDALAGLATDNSQGEYYLTDLVAAYRRRRLRVETLSLDDATELRGVNTRVDLAELTRVVRDRKRRELMLSGVTLEDPATAYIDDEVEIGPDTIVEPCVVISGRTVIGARCRIRTGARLTNAIVDDDREVGG